MRISDNESLIVLKSGEYSPISLEDAVYRSKEVLKRFIANGIKILRIGLCSSENLRSDDTYLAGPNHAALGELIEGEVYYDLIRELLLKNEITGENVTVYAPAGSVSKVLGHGGKNKLRLVNEFGIKRFKVLCEDGLLDYQIRI